MATFRFRNNETKEEWEEWMSLSERDSFLEENPHIEQLVNGFPGYVYDHTNFMNKVPNGFRDVLKQIKKQNPGSTIDNGNIGTH